MFRKLTEIYYNSHFEITQNIWYDTFIVKETIPWVYRTLDEHIEIYEQLIKDLKVLKEIVWQR